MSVLIRGMQIPSECSVCPMIQYGVFSGNTWCTLCSINKAVLAMDFKAIQFEGRHKDCPLVDLGSHGDLIDRDALSLRGKLKLIKECEIQIYGGASWDFAGKCIAAIEDAPTIIEAEGAKE